jgi:hypothetical protein
MQTERKVFEKLFTSDKVELESQKVELALIDDIADIRTQLSNFNSEIKGAGDRALKDLEIVKNVGTKALYAFKDGNNYISKIEDLYRELGVPDKAKNDPQVKALLLQMDLLLKYRKSYNF